MTAHDEFQNETRRLLEQILETVDSIDDKLEDLRNRFGDYLEDARYGRSWYGTNGWHEE